MEALNSELTLLSFGGGQDSTAILYKIIYDPDFKKRWVKGKLIVVMGNTLNEHPETYLHCQYVKELCMNHGIEFYLLGMEYTRGDWKGGVVGFYEAGNRIGSVTFGKTCTAKLKIDPIYEFINDWITLRFGIDGSNAHEMLNLPKNTTTNLAIREFGARKGKINVLISIAKEEESRLAPDVKDPKHYQFWTRKYYPLVVEGMNRKACQEYIRSTGHEVPIPSACIICHYMNDEELIYISRFQPDWWQEWIDLERRKIEHHALSYSGKIFSLIFKSYKGEEVIVEYIDRPPHYDEKKKITTTVQDMLEETMQKEYEKLIKREANKKNPRQISLDDFEIRSRIVENLYDISKTIKSQGRDNGKIVNNNGVKGVAPDGLLPQQLEKAIKNVLTDPDKGKEWLDNDEAIKDYRFSHGHCVSNKF